MAVTIAFVLDGKVSTYENIKEKIRGEMIDLMEPETSLQFQTFEGDWSVPSIEKALKSAYADENVSVVITVGVISSDLAAHQKKLPKPTIASNIIGRKIQNLPATEEDTSGISNLNYLEFPSSIQEDLTQLYSLTNTTKIAFVSDHSTMEAFPKFYESLKENAKKGGLTLTFVPGVSSAEGIVNAIPKDFKAAYVTMMPRFTQEEIKKLAEDLIEKKIPSFSLLSSGFVNQGFLASMSPNNEVERLARRVALNVQSIFLGEDPKNFSVMISDELQLSVNVNTARLLGVDLPWNWLLDANIFGEEDLPKPPRLTLIKAVERGLIANPDLASVWKEVLVGIEEVNRAKAKTRLQLEVSSLARFIDRDRAIYSGGFEPQSAVFGSATASQMLYSNRLLGDVRVQRYLQYARCENYQVSKLDLIFEVTRAYLDLLRSQTLEKIQVNNMKLTQTNLQMAKRRVRIGVARFSEVYRWESQLSDNRSSVVEARFQTLSSAVKCSSR